MDRSHFAKPISIFVGLGFPHEVGTSAEAYRVLNEWTGSRGPTHTIALNICRQAVADESTVEAARLAFEAFARSRGILALEAMVGAAESFSDEWHTA